MIGEKNHEREATRSRLSHPSSPEIYSRTRSTLAKTRRRNADPTTAAARQLKISDLADTLPGYRHSSDRRIGRLARVAATLLRTEDDRVRLGPQRPAAGVVRLVAEVLLDAQQLVVLGGAVGA